MTHKNKVLLMAPPGDQVYMRDMYCSTTAKGHYCWPPSDLLILSGVLKDEFEVHVIDAIPEKLSCDETLRRIIDIKPDAVVSLSSSISVNVDMAFLKKMKEEVPCKLIISGDLFYFEPKASLEKFTFVDAVLFNYTTDDIKRYLKGECKGLNNLAYRKANKIIVGEKKSVRNYSYPPPLLELFPYRLYTTPFMRRKPLSGINTNFGCPCACTFCSQCLIPFALRDMDNVMEELRYLKSKGVKELFIKDFTFNAGLERTKDLMRRMIDEDLKFTWTCEMVVNNFDEELVKLMKKAGCHTIMFGVESGNDQVLKEIRKGITVARVKMVFDICHRAGMRTLAHFIIGFPEDSEDTIKETIDLSKRIKSTFAVFNIYVPRIGSVERKAIIGEGGLEDADKLDSSGKDIRSYCPKVDTKRIIRLRRKAYLGFYLNPMTMIRILVSMRTPTEVWILFRNFLSMFSKY